MLYLYDIEKNIKDIKKLLFEMKIDINLYFDLIRMLDEIYEEFYIERIYFTNTLNKRSF